MKEEEEEEDNGRLSSCGRMGGVRSRLRSILLVKEEEENGWVSRLLNRSSSRKEEKGVEEDGRLSSCGKLGIRRSR